MNGNSYQPIIKTRLLLVNLQLRNKNFLCVSDKYRLYSLNLKKKKKIKSGEGVFFPKMIPVVSILSHYSFIVAISNIFLLHQTYFNFVFSYLLIDRFHCTLTSFLENCSFFFYEGFMFLFQLSILEYRIPFFLDYKVK